MNIDQQLQQHDRIIKLISQHFGLPSLKFTTDLNSAFVVIDAMRPECKDIIVGFASACDDRGNIQPIASAQWEVEISPLKNSLLKGAIVTHESAPMAICIAALRAMGVSDDEINA